MESKKSNEKKINVILDGEKIRNLITQHNDEFNKLKYVKKDMEVDSQTGVSSISIDIGGEGKKPPRRLITQKS